jgi:hypothetical protein
MTDNPEHPSKPKVRRGFAAMTPEMRSALSRLGGAKSKRTKLSRKAAVSAPRSSPTD